MEPVKTPALDREPATSFFPSPTRFGSRRVGSQSNGVTLQPPLGRVKKKKKSLLKLRKEKALNSGPGFSH